METESKHTPGPWTYEERCSGIAIIKPETETEEEYIIASIIPQNEDDDDQCSDLDEANAELIARAPELLEQVTALTKENERLNIWKNEMSELTAKWDKIWDYFQNHYDCNPGDNVSEKALEFIQERDRLKAENSKLKWLDIENKSQLSRLREERKELVEALQKVCLSLPYSGALGADIKSLLSKFEEPKQS